MGQAMRKEGEAPESTFLCIRTPPSTCTHITLGKLVLGLVVWGSANTYFAKAPAINKAGLGTKRDRDTAFVLGVPLGEAAQCHLHRCSKRMRWRGHAAYC